MRKLAVRGAIIVYAMSAAIFCAILPKGEKATATDLGVMCINAVYPSASIEFADSRDNESMSETDGADNAGEIENAGNGETDGNTAVSGESTEPVVLGDEPLVLIVHTHATESYLPESGSNFHSKGEKNTVRDVGDVLAASLEAEGISVVHDKTLHDDPSYNSSYSRSAATVKTLLKKYPSVKCVIDLHRDAVSSEAPAATVSVNGKKCAKYSYVIGTLASTYRDNKAFISNLNKVASSDYDGYTGKVLERGYSYNQGYSSKSLLLEIGYNRNQIEEARNSAEIFGKILADTLKKGY